MPLAIPEELTVTKLKEAFTKVVGSGKVDAKQFGVVLDSLEVQAKALDKLLLFDFIDTKEVGVVDYMQFYYHIKESMPKFGECTASDLVLNIAMEHNMTKRGRTVRMNFKKGHNKVNVLRMRPAPTQESVERNSRLASREPSPKSVSKKVEERKGVDIIDFQREGSRSPSNRRNSNSTGRNRQDTIDPSFDGNEDSRDGLSFEGSECSDGDKIDDRFLELGDDFSNRERINSRASEDVEDQNEKQPLAFRSVLSEDMFLSPKIEDEKFSFIKQSKRDSGYDKSFNSNLMVQHRFDSLEDTLRFVMGESKSMIMEAIQEHLRTESSLLKEITQLASAAPLDIPGNHEDSSMIKGDTQRYIKRVAAADIGRLNDEIADMRKELRALRDASNTKSGPEIHRTTESVKKMLSNIDDHLAFNLGTKVDHLESKLNRLLSIISKEKQKNIEPLTETELRDERKRLNDSMKFIEAQVKKFKIQKTDYKNQIRTASEKIRKERKQLFREKERINKETSAIKQQKLDIKERMHEVNRVQRKLNKIKTSAASTPKETIAPAQIEDIVRMKEMCAHQEKQLLILKNGIKENRKKFHGTLKELKKKNKHLDNEKIDLQNDVVNSTTAVQEASRKRTELEQQVAELQQEREGLIARSGAMIEAKKQDKESIERERTYLAKMKEKLQHLAQALTEERNNNEAAIELDQKAKNIASQMQLLADKRETLYREREQFEAERNAVLTQWAEKEKELKQHDEIIRAMREKKDAQAKIMRSEWPRFKTRQSQLEDQEKKNEEDENQLRKNKDFVERQLAELKEKTIKLEEQKVNIERRSKKAVEEEALVKEIEKKLEKLGEDLTESKTKLQVKQDAFESIKQDFEKAAGKGKSESKIKQLISEEQKRLRAEFDAEKKGMEREFNEKMAGKIDEKELRKKAEQMIKEEKLVLEQERERIKYLAKELHRTMDDMVGEKEEFEDEKRKWIKVIEDMTEGDSVVKLIQKMFERERGKKKK